MKKDALDAQALADMMDYPGPAALTLAGGPYFNPSVKHAIAPPALIKKVVSRQQAHQYADGFWRFEVAPDWNNHGLVVRPVPKSYFETFEQTKQSGMKVLSRTLDLVEIKSHRYAEIHVYAWPRLLFAWIFKHPTKGWVVGIRAVKTRQELEAGREQRANPKLRPELRAALEKEAEDERYLIRWSKGLEQEPPRM